MKNSEINSGISFFSVNVSEYVSTKNFIVSKPSSLDFPKDYSVMFVTEGFIDRANMLADCENCLVFWPETMNVPYDIQLRHAVVKCLDPRTEYCRFYDNHKITNLPEIDEYELVNGAFIAKKAKIGRRCKIFPGAYLSSEVILGDNVYIGSGVKLLGRIKVGDNVVIRENSVLGADGLSTNRDENGRALTMPQFGGIIIENDVEIGALTVIGRGAIDDTIIKRGSKIDNSCFISHNVRLGENTFVVGESIMFGSSSTGDQAYISGNSTIRDGIHIGSKAVIGMGSVVVKDVGDSMVVKGNPAK